MNGMKTITKLASAIKATLSAPVYGRYELIDTVRALVPQITPAPTWGKKQIVAATAAAMLDLDSIEVRLALDDAARAQTWRELNAALARLGDAGMVIGHGSLCCRVPCAPCACPGDLTNWGLPNATEVAKRLLDWAD